MKKHSFFGQNLFTKNFWASVEFEITEKSLTLSDAPYWLTIYYIQEMNFFLNVSETSDMY